jgi:hypothetical protein
LKLNGDPDATLPDVYLQPTDAAEVVLGPVRVLSKREVCWKIKARENGYHRLVFQVDGQAVEKELAVGDGFLRVSMKRPGWDWSEALLHPWEQPFGRDASVQSIEIDYPRRVSWTCGSDWWIAYWFIVSMIAALAFRRLLNVNL